MLVHQGSDHGSVTHIANNNTIAPSTLARHWKKWRDRIHCDGFTDELIAEINKERRGGHNKAMTNEEELVLDTQLSSLNSDSHMDFTNRIIKGMATDIVNQRDPELLQLQQPFKASDGWVVHYKKRYGMSSGVRQPKSPHIQPDESHVNNHRDECQQAVKSSGTLFYFNCDETKWHLINPQRLVVKRHGEDPHIQLPAKVSQGFTVILGGNAKGDKLRPSSVIIKGDDDKCMEPYINKYGSSVWYLSYIIRLVK